MNCNSQGTVDRKVVCNVYNVSSTGLHVMIQLVCAVGANLPEDVSSFSST